MSNIESIANMTFEQKMMVGFLVKESIKSISYETWKNELWTKIKENRSEKSKSTRMEDAIWKAHRDVMTGRRRSDLLSNYKEKCGNIIKELTDICEKACKDKKTIGFKYLRCVLIKYTQNGSNVEFGALQKLINMTLKYFIILRIFEENAEVPEVDLETCDCPLDRTILEKLHGELPNDKKGIVWSKEKYGPLNWTEIDEEKYDEIQKAISEYYAAKKKPTPFGRLTFDFENWMRQ